MNPAIPHLLNSPENSNKKTEIENHRPASARQPASSARRRTTAAPVQHLRAVPGPRLVTQLPSVTTRPSDASRHTSLSASARMARRPLVVQQPMTPQHHRRRCAEIAPYIRPAAFCAHEHLRQRAQSTRCSAPGMPPGSTIKSNVSPSQSPISLSATSLTPREPSPTNCPRTRPSPLPPPASAYR